MISCHRAGSRTRTCFDSAEVLRRRMRWSWGNRYFAHAQRQWYGRFVTLLTAVLALANIALVAVTWKYVKLTARLVELHEQSLRAAEERERSARSDIRVALMALADRIRAALATFPREYQRAEDVRRVTLWGTHDVQRLDEYARYLGKAEIQHAARAVEGLRFLFSLADSVKTVPRERGYDWAREFPEQRWSAYLAQLDAADHALEQLGSARA